MASLEKRLTTEFRQRHAIRMKAAQAQKRIGHAIGDLLKNDERYLHAVRDLRRIANARRRTKLGPPKLARVVERIFTGSMGATIPPPYDYQWTWDAVAGDAGPFNATADKNAGNLSVLSDSTGGNGGSCSSRSAVGIYFYPPAANGFLRVSATPGFNFWWIDNEVFSNAHTDGFIGLYVATSDLSGFDTGPVVDQVNMLWNHDCPNFHADNDQGSSSGYALNAGFPVDNDHQYAIWVWCGVDASSGGHNWFYSSGAIDTLSATVPSITWEFD
jgi:hypothetical protein